MVKGKLHNYLGIDKDEVIPMNRVAPLLHSKRKSVRKMAQFAYNIKKGK